MFQANQRRWWVPAFLFTLVLIFDQWSKFWVVENLGPTPLMRSIPIAGDLVRIVYWRNTGVAFGLFQNNSGFFSILALLISAGAVYAYVTRLPNQQVSVQISMGLILGGAIGNVIDRVRLGYVVDFIQVGWWPIFNIADSSITIGATLLGLFLLFAPDEPPQTVQAGPVDDALLDDLLRKDAGTLEQNRQNPGS